eukprot:236839_1
MPVKTDQCVFSEEKIYPGHGVSFVRRDGKKLLFVTCKTRHLFLSGRKALNHRWTKSWRRAHKKESILRQVKKDKGRRTLKSERGIEGLSLQELLRKKNQTAEQRKAAMDAKRKAAAQQKPQTRKGKKADLNSRLRELRKKRREKEEKKEEEKKSGKKGGKKGSGKAKGKQGGKGKGKGKGKKKGGK